jgi:hypothetical protein
MTAEYIYNEMTWNEVNDALEYVHLYDLKDSHIGAGIWKKNKKISDWWRRKKDRDSALLDFAQKARAKNG